MSALPLANPEQNRRTKELIDTLLSRHHDFVRDSKEIIDTIAGIEDHLERLGVKVERYAPHVNVTSEPSDLIAKLLEENKRPMTEKDIADALRLNLGNVRRSVTQSMNAKKGKLVRYHDGTVGLKEWKR